LSFPRQRKGLNAACWNSSADHAVHSNSSHQAVQKSSVLPRLTITISPLAQRKERKRSAIA
jgi:hypothetical protein